MDTMMKLPPEVEEGLLSEGMLTACLWRDACISLNEASDTDEHVYWEQRASELYDETVKAFTAACEKAYAAGQASGDVEGGPRCRCGHLQSDHKDDANGTYAFCRQRTVARVRACDCFNYTRVEAQQ